MNVGELVERHPELFFDFEQFFLSYRLREQLAQRLSSFTEHAAANGGWPHREQILAALQAGRVEWVPFFRPFRQAARLEELPLIDKSLLRARPEEFLAADARPADLWGRTTTGSSGPPVPIVYSPEFYFDFLLLSLRKAAVLAGLDDRVREREVFCLAVSDNRASRDYVLADPLEQVGLSVQIVVDERDPATLERVLALTAELAPACLSSKPSVLEMLADLAPEPPAPEPTAPPAPGRQPVFILSSGSLLGAELRRNLERKLATRVVDTYGMTEFGLIASECPAGALHIDTSALVVEVVGDDGAPVPDGEAGELVLSSVLNLAMPLLRYRTGDLGVVETGPCACGRRTPRLARLLGRKINCFRLAKGGLFAPTYFNDLFVRFPALEEFQITQNAIGDYTVLVELRRDVPRPEEVLDDIERYVAAAIPDEPQVEVRQSGFFKDSKFERFRTCL
jgi:phenylacetate-CoA ligase